MLPGTHAGHSVQPLGSANIFSILGIADPQQAGAVASGDTPWTCRLCTYIHEGPQAGFLACGMCGRPRLL